MANLNISERRLPQDGRISLTSAATPGGPARFHAADPVRRIGRAARAGPLAPSTWTSRPSGLPKYIYDYITETIQKPNGIFIVTGPTGSGKTTTLYSCLRRINTIDSKLLTAEDPVEYDIDGIMQVPINEAIGLTFGKALRSFLRQDPDIIMIGEMRDLETAQIAIQASLTGHLVLTTLHTNDAPGAVTRLIDMGVEPFLISSTLMAVLGPAPGAHHLQEMPHPFEPTESQLALLNLSPHDLGDKVFYYGRGCSTCNDTGYKGRKGIFELLVDHRRHPQPDQRARPHGGAPPESHRAGHDHPARGRLAQHLRRRHHHRRSRQIHLAAVPDRGSYAKIQLRRDGFPRARRPKGTLEVGQPERSHRPRQGDGPLPHQDRGGGQGQGEGQGQGRQGGAAAKGAKPKARRASINLNIKIPGLSGRVKPKVLTTFTRQFATLVDAGLPLLRGLRVLEKQERNATLKDIIGELGLSIEGGSTFSEGLAQHPKVFNRLYVNMVKAGELGGVLEVVLNRLAEFMEKAQKIKGKVIAAMFYPVAVIIVAVAILVILMV